MQPRTKKGRTWANDDAAELKAPPTASTVQVQAKAKEASGAPDDPAAVAEDSVMEDGQANTEEMDDLEWMKRRMGQNQTFDRDDEKVFEQDDEEDNVPEQNRDPVRGYSIHSHYLCY